MENFPLSKAEILPSAEDHQPQRILVRGVNWLGDAVMTTPALDRLREACPKARITLLSHAKLTDLWQHHPSLDAVETFTSRDNVWQIARRLRREKFDVALVLPNSPRSALEVWLAGIPVRIGYAASWRSRFLTRSLPPRAGAVPTRKRSVAEIRRLLQASPPEKIAVEATAHHIFQYLHLIAEAMGTSPAPIAPRLVVACAEIEAIKRRFAIPTEQIDPRPLFGMNPGAAYGPAKRWPRERFVAAGIELQRRTRCRWLILGGKNDLETCASIANELQRAAEQPLGRAGVAKDLLVLNLAGATTLRELCAALKACAVVLTNDTGPMHVAAAVGTPVVVPFGSTSPRMTGPGLPRDPKHHLLTGDVPCSPCFRRECPIDFRCMTGITVDRVVAAVIEAAGLSS
jgi:lipopolysaccharide heptosyltransferase II